MAVRLTRRDVLVSGIAACALPGVVSASDAIPLLTAEPGLRRLVPDPYPSTEIWGYDGSVPGPEVRVVQGARVQRRVRNGLPQPTTVHWHGVRIDNAMDGVPGVTQDPIPPGKTFLYDFVVPDAGTYWYHSHNKNVEQVARGLYGPLIVEEATPPDVDAELVLTLDDWWLDPETAAIHADFDDFHALSHAGRIGNLLTVNGTFDPALPVKAGQRLRLRLINAANARVFDLSLPGFRAWTVALDGMPLGSPVPLDGRVVLAPAQRVDLIVDVTETEGGTANLVSHERDSAFGLASFPVGAGSGPRRSDPPAALPPNPLSEPENADTAPLHRMEMSGGAMRWLASARLKGVELDGRELAQLGKFWALAGDVDRPESPFLTATRGETHRIVFANGTGFPHAMHLHGHHFRIRRPDGSPGAWRDTVLVHPGEETEVVLVADNPGDWLLHCHMLGHAAAGMLSWIRVL